MNRILTLGLVLALGTILAMAYALHAPAGEEAASLLGLPKADTIRIGYAVEPPYAFIDADGRVTGESPEVARHIVEGLRIPNIEWRLGEFVELIPELEAGRIDVIAAGMFITPERARHVGFSEPTFHVQQGLLVGRGNPHALHAYADIGKDLQLKLAVLSGSIEEALLLEMGVAPAQLLRVPDAGTGRASVATAAAQGLALSLPALRWQEQDKARDGTEIAAPFAQPEARQHHPGFGAFAFRKQDQQLQAAWNKVQAAYVGSAAHRALIARFGFDADALPGAVRTRDVLAR
ncbi:MAG: ectoine/hydroxyectoine ABC transporter substrate-binding protein EhuB [Proteobacteria bacterium]|nr:ectoine/hydroxyectoine ABC transporter substrate-binding protein EhuB [Pseudomonadota bacterium]